MQIIQYALIKLTLDYMQFQKTQTIRMTFHTVLRLNCYLFVDLRTSCWASLVALYRIGIARLHAPREASQIDLENNSLTHSAQKIRLPKLI